MRISLGELIILLHGLLQSDVAFRMIFSEPQKKAITQYRKITVRPVWAKQGVAWHIAFWDGRKETHSNQSSDELFTTEQLRPWLEQFRQLQIQASQGDFHIFSNNDGSLRMLKRPSQQEVAVEDHNRSKNYHLREGETAPFLVELGVMTPSGKVVKARYDKFRQINRFLEMVEDIYEHLPSTDTIRVVDFGCGRSYLTFAIHWLLTARWKRQVDIIGLDLNEDVVAECSMLAHKMKLEGLRFEVGDIADWHAAGNIDLVVSLHACDTATDAALVQALRWQSRVILAAPCCQHQLASQLRAVDQDALLKHGILRERLGALITDALRASALESLGYRCQIMEFIDLEHTPKNLLLRAVRDPSIVSPTAAAQYMRLKQVWQIENFALEEFLDSDRKKALLSVIS